MISATLFGLLLAASAVAQPPGNTGGGSGLPQKAIPPGNTGGGAGLPLKTTLPDPNSLEALMAAALKSNPDIQVSEAKVREAEAGLNKARITVMQLAAGGHGTLQ